MAAGHGVQRGRWAAGPAVQLASHPHASWSDLLLLGKTVVLFLHACLLPQQRLLGGEGRAVLFILGGLRGLQENQGIGVSADRAPLAPSCPPSSSMARLLLEPQPQVLFLAQGSGPGPPSTQEGHKKEHLPDPGAASEDLGRRKDINCGTIQRRPALPIGLLGPSGEGTRSPRPSTGALLWSNVSTAGGREIFSPNRPLTWLSLSPTLPRMDGVGVQAGQGSQVDLNLKIQELIPEASPPTCSVPREPCLPAPFPPPATARCLGVGGLSTGSDL